MTYRQLAIAAIAIAVALAVTIFDVGLRTIIVAGAALACPLMMFGMHGRHGGHTPREDPTRRRTDGSRS